MSNVQLAPSMFHATPYWNIHPIVRTGIDPQMSRGQLPFSWYCDEDKVQWAITHTALRYSCDVQEVVVFEVVEKPMACFFIAPQPGLYRTGMLMRPCAMYPAYNWFPIEK